MLSTQRTPAKPAPAPEPEPVVEAPTPTTVHETAVATDLYEYDIEGPTVHEGVPDPPDCIKQRFERNHWVWRWLSKPHVDKKGKRMYTVYSPTDDERTAIDKGDCPPGVRVSVDNLVYWGEDAFLGYLPQRFFDQRQRELTKLNDRLLKSAKDPEPFKELVKRAGFKSPSMETGPDDRPRYRAR